MVNGIDVLHVHSMPLKKYPSLGAPPHRVKATPNKLFC
jgi:hypothetical protein